MQMKLIHQRMRVNFVAKQNVHGILLVNKPKGLTSNAVLQKVKHLFQAKKAGHCGSLDPMATGMLPICFGEATKFSQFSLDADKCYSVTAQLGVSTNTGDAMGEVLSVKENFVIAKQQLDAVLSDFNGQIEQVPPMFSALKHHGQPLYKLARSGLVVDRKPRVVTIYKLQLDSFVGDTLSLSVICSKGTYIRTLLVDIGDKLGVGAHLTRLHREYTFGFAENKMYTLEELQNKKYAELLSCLLPVDRGILHLPKKSLVGLDVNALFHGQLINNQNFGKPGDIIRLYNEQEEFLGIGEVCENNLKAKRLVAR